MDYVLMSLHPTQKGPLRCGVVALVDLSRTVEHGRSSAEFRSLGFGEERTPASRPRTLRSLRGASRELQNHSGGALEFPGSFPEGCVEGLLWPAASILYVAGTLGMPGRGVSACFVVFGITPRTPCGPN
jgi:hypothetical protein